MHVVPVGQSAGTLHARADVDVVTPRHEARPEIVARLVRRDVREDRVLEGGVAEVEHRAPHRVGGVVADRHVDERRLPAVVHERRTGRGSVAADCDVGECDIEVTAEPAASAGSVAAHRDAVQRGGAGVVDPSPEAGAGARSVVADRGVRERQDVRVRDAAAKAPRRILRHDDVDQVQGRHLVGGGGARANAPAVAGSRVAIANRHARDGRGAVGGHVEHAIKLVPIDDHAARAGARDGDRVEDVEVAGGSHVLPAPGERLAEAVDARGRKQDRVGAGVVVGRLDGSPQGAETGPRRCAHGTRRARIGLVGGAVDDVGHHSSRRRCAPQERDARHQKHDTDSESRHPEPGLPFCNTGARPALRGGDEWPNRGRPVKGKMRVPAAHLLRARSRTRWTDRSQAWSPASTWHLL